MFVAHSLLLVGLATHYRESYHKQVIAWVIDNQQLTEVTTVSNGYKKEFIASIK